MGIRVRNLSDEFWQFVIPLQPSAAQIGGDGLEVPFSAFIRTIRARVAVAGTQGTGGTTLPTLNIKNNAANFFPNATPITFASGATVATYDAGISGLFPVSKHDFLQMDLTVLFNGTAPVQPILYLVAFVVSRIPMQIVTDDVDPFSS